jgi:hypothetical protein
MGLNKKAIIFTFMSILIVALFSLIFMARYEAPIDRKNDVIRTRINNVNEFVEDFELYSEDVLGLVSTKAVDGLLEYISTNHTAIFNFEQEFTECVLNGTMQGNFRPCPGMQGNTLKDWLEKINTTAQQELSMDFDYSFTNLTINQSEPWYLDARFVLTYTVTDVYGNWQSTKNITAKIPIEGFKDPLYVLNRTVNNTIRANKNPNLGKNLTLLKEFIQSNQYRTSSNSPSFIMRMENDLGNSRAGIFSMVNPNNFTYKANASYVDFLFFNNTHFDCDKLYNVNGLDPEYVNVTIDETHAWIDLDINYTYLNNTCP